MIRALWVLARPRLLPFVLLLPTLGYGWAHWDRALANQGPGAFALVLLAWTSLHAGTLWLNAAVDQDEGDVLMGDAVAVPEQAGLAGYVALVLSVLLAFGAGPVALFGTLLCALLAVAYSHPSTLWKGHPVLGPAVNGVGYGLCSPMVGWACVDVAINPRTLVMWLAGAMGVLGAYFLAQAFQEEEDRARGYRTLVATHGTAAVVTAARLCFAVGLVVALALSLVGWLPRLLLLAVPAWWWVDADLAELGMQASQRGAVRLVYKMAWTVGLCVGLAFVDYVHASFNNAPVAGLGTRAGHPSDRPRLPPAELWAWEQRQRARDL